MDGFAQRLIVMALVAIGAIVVMAGVLGSLGLGGEHVETLERRDMGVGMWCFTIKHHPEALSCVYAPDWRP